LLADIEALAQRELETIPPELKRHLGPLVIRVEEFPDEETEAEMGLESPFDILGLYHGVALTRRTTDYGGVLPDRISIYRRPILWMCSSEAEVVEQVLITVMHELGHHFGLDDDRLHELGWG